MDRIKCQKTLNRKEKLSNKLDKVKRHKQQQENIPTSCQSKLNENIVKTNQSCENKLVQGPCSVNLTTPDILSALQLAHAIQAVSSEKGSLQEDKLEPPNMPKGLKNANIPFTKQVYKNLVDLEVNDEEIITGKGIPNRKTNFTKNVDDNFKLHEHFKPDFSSQFYTEPEIEEFEHSKIEYYNGFDIYNLLESLPDVI